jgi:hypothetical protein
MQTVCSPRVTNENFMDGSAAIKKKAGENIKKSVKKDPHRWLRRFDAETQEFLMQLEIIIKEDRQEGQVNDSALECI